MDNPWIIHGCPWIIHGHLWISMDFQWLGKPVGHAGGTGRHIPGELLGWETCTHSLYTSGKPGWGKICFIECIKAGPEFPCGDLLPGSQSEESIGLGIKLRVEVGSY